MICKVSALITVSKFLIKCLAHSVVVFIQNFLYLNNSMSTSTVPLL